MVIMYRNPPAWLSESEFEEFNDVTHDKIQSWTSLTKLRRLEKYMREEGFLQTAEVTHKRIVELGGSNSHDTQPCIHSSDVQDMLKSMEFWQANMKEKDAELQKLQDSRKSKIHDSEQNIPKVRKLISEIPEPNKEKQKGKQIENEEEKPKTILKKDIRSGREYYEGWDKYVTKWEKESEGKPEAPGKEPKCEEVNRVPERMKRKETKLSEKSPIEREWLANREREKGNDLFKAKEYNASLQAYTKAIETYDCSSVTYANRAAVYLKMNRFDEAYADCNQALKLDPHNSKALLRRAKASLEMDEAAKALNDINDGLKLDSQNEDLLHLKKLAQDALKKHSNSELVKKDLLPNSRRFAIEEVESIVEPKQIQDPTTEQCNGSLVEDSEESKKCPVEEMAESKLIEDQAAQGSDETESKEPPVEDMTVSKQVQDTIEEATKETECIEPPVEDIAVSKKIEAPGTQATEETENKEPLVEDMAVSKQIKDPEAQSTEETAGKECPVEGMSESKKIEDPAGRNPKKCKEPQDSLHKSRLFAIEEVDGTLKDKQNVGNETSHVPSECKQSPVITATVCGNDDQGSSTAMSKQWHEKGNVFFRNGNFKEAYDCYTKSLVYVPNNAVVMANRSLCQLRLNNNAAAEADASSAIVMDSSYVKAFRHRGFARHALGRLQEGIDDLKKVLQAIPGDTKAALELKTMEEKICNARFLPKRVGPMIIEEIQENTVPAYCVKGISKGTPRCTETPRVQEKQVDLKSEYPRDQKTRSEIKSETLNIQKTKSEILNIQKNYADLKSNIENKPTLHNIPRTQPGHLSKSEIKSTADVDSLKFKRTTSAAEERTYGNTLFNTGKYLDAINVYSKSLELDPNAAPTYTNRALCYLKINQPEKAIDDCTQAIALDAENYKAYYRRAISKKQINDFPAALEDLKVLKKLYPDDSIIKSQIDEIETLLPKNDENSKAKETTMPMNILNKPRDALSDKTSLHVKEILQNEEKWKTATINGTPKTALEFERAFMNLVKQPEVLKHYIQSIETAMYPKIFKEDLNARLLKLVGNFIKENVCLFESQEILNILKGFIGVKRFKVAVMLLQPCEKDIFKMLFESVLKSSDKFSLDVSELKNEYMCK